MDRIQGTIMIKCNRCGLKLGIFKRKYAHEESGDNAVILCGKCNEIYVEEIKIKLQEEKNLKKIALEEEKTKNKEIVEEYLEKYLASKEWNSNENIASLYQNKDNRLLFTNDANSLANARERFESDLEYYLSLNAEDYDPEKSAEVLKEIEKREEFIELFDDLESLHKLLDKKGVRTDYLELITSLSGIIMVNLRKAWREACKPYFVRMSNKLGGNASKEDVIKELLTIMPDAGNYPFIISVVLDEFNIKYEMQELSGLGDRLNKEVDLEVFEKNLESSNKIKIEELSKLSGYELEKYLVMMFNQLGWDVQELELSDHQIADLIVKDDDETIAVRLVIGTEQVTENEIQKVELLKNKYHADKGIVVTDSIFTNNAVRYAGSSNIELWNGEKLRKMLRRSKPRLSDAFFNNTAASSDQISLGVLSIACPFCESSIQIEQEKLPGEGERYTLTCPSCGLELGLYPCPYSVECPFCESDIQIEEEKLPGEGEECTLNCPSCGMDFNAHKTCPSNAQNN